MTARNPWWWPMMEPPLLDREIDRDRVYVELITGRGSTPEDVPRATRENLQMNSAEVERITQNERVMAIARKIMIRDAELLKRLAD